MTTITSKDITGRVPKAQRGNNFYFIKGLSFESYIRAYADYTGDNNGYTTPKEAKAFIKFAEKTLEQERAGKIDGTPDKSIAKVNKNGQLENREQKDLKKTVIFQELVT